MKFAAAHDKDAAGVLGRFLHGMGNENDTHLALFEDFHQLGENVVPAHRIKTGTGLIHDQVIRFHGNDASNRDAAHLSA